jgi:hypothetical protein
MTAAATVATAEMAAVAISVGPVDEVEYLVRFQPFSRVTSTFAPGGMASSYSAAGSGK